MADIWDAKMGLACLLDALNSPELDIDLDRDIVELEALLTRAANRGVMVAQSHRSSR